MSRDKLCECISTLTLCECKLNYVHVFKLFKVTCTCASTLAFRTVIPSTVINAVIILIFGMLIDGDVRALSCVTKSLITNHN